jgi:hypothetical protein
MGISGILTMNIDGFAKRAFSVVHSGKALAEFDGNDIHERVLKNNVPFVGNLHGNLEDDRSWIFTQGELNLLLQNLRYREFVRTILCSRTVVFMGITVDDVAVSRHLEYFQEIKFDAGDHFWLTERSDKRTADFAESLGIRPIFLELPGDDYSAVSEFFIAIEKFVPPEIDAPPAYSQRAEKEGPALLQAKELCVLSANDIRWQLNVNAASILSPADENAYMAYESFCKKYDEAIYRAWFVGTDGGSNVLLDFVLESEIQHPGAFGRVFRARDPKGDIIAVKVLHEGIRRDPERLQSFRRGARAMRILTDHQLDGMVRYRDACEIPAMVAMDWIEGPNLKTAVEARYISNWNDVLRVGSRLAEILRSAHRLPERVLHRDVRPPNIMMENRYSDDINWNLVVLDFDLSWHRDSVEKSISAASSPTGYLAPEQLSRQAGVSTRSAAVDSFGVGMTLFFMVSRRDPTPNEHLLMEWDQTVNVACRNFGEVSWKCIPRRFARLILKATRDRQHDRCDMALIERELIKLRQLEAGRLEYLTTVVVMEEIVARSGQEYEWNSDCDTAILKMVRGFEVVLKSDELSGLVCGELRWTQAYAQEYERIRKYLPKKATAAVKILKSGNWVTIEKPHGSYTVAIDFQARLPVDEVRVDQLAHALSCALSEISKIA